MLRWCCHLCRVVFLYCNLSYHYEIVIISYFYKIPYKIYTKLFSAITVFEAKTRRWMLQLLLVSCIWISLSYFQNGLIQWYYMQWQNIYEIWIWMLLTKSIIFVSSLEHDIEGVKVMVFNPTFNNISVLLIEETGVLKESHQTVASHWQTLSELFWL